MTAAETVTPKSRSVDAWRGVLSVGLMAAAVVMYLCIVGIVPVFGERPLIKDLLSLGEVSFLSLGQLSLLLTFLSAGYVAARRAPAGAASAILAGGVAGRLARGLLWGAHPP